MSPPKRNPFRLAASLALIPLLAIVVPLSARAAGPPMKQVKKYESASSASAAVVAPFQCVGFTTPCNTVGVTWGSLGRDPVSFRVPSRARSFTIAIVDDSGLPVRAFVSGDVVSVNQPWPNPVCGTSPVKMSLARGARVVHVWPDVGLWAVPNRVTLPEMPSGCLLSPLSVPTEGLITTIFSRRG